MENKEIKLNAAELNDDALENVSGGEALIVSPCAKCGGLFTGDKLKIADGKYYCLSCWPG